MTDSSGIKVDSFHVYDSSRNMVFRYANPNADTDMNDAIYCDPGAIEPGQTHTFVVYTNKGEVRFSNTPVLEKKPGSE